MVERDAVLIWFYKFGAGATQGSNVLEWCKPFSDVYNRKFIDSKLEVFTTLHFDANPPLLYDDLTKEPGAHWTLTPEALTLIGAN